MEKILFEEEQRFNRKRMELILRVGLLVLIIACSFIVFSRGTDQRDSVFTVMILTGICLLLFLLFRKARLVMQIRTDGIYVRFPPLQPSFIKYRWEDIKEAYIREYKPLSEYGGWGIRIGLSGRAYNVSGTIGLQLVFHDGSLVLIGTHHPDQIARILQQLGK